MESIVSVIIPTYKGMEKLPRALNSILDQTYKSVEVVVVDDNEPESAERYGTEVVMREYLHLDNVKYIRHKKTRSRAAARNTGITASTGSYLCFLNDDDFYLSERIEKSLKHLEANPGYDGIICGVVITSEKRLNSVLIPENPVEQRNLLLDDCVLCTGSNLFLSRYAVEFAGGFDELFIHNQNNEFMLRILKSFKVLNLEEILIVKSEVSNTERLDYRNLRKLKELYMLKFGDAIDSLAPEEQTKFYIRQYEELFFAAVKSGRKEYMTQSLRELKIFRDISLKDRVHILISEKHLSKKKIYKTLRPVYDRSKKRVVSHQVKSRMDPLVKENILNIIYSINGFKKPQNNKF